MRLSPYCAELRDRVSNHGPMLAEALSSLGHEEAIGPCVESYLARNRGRLQASPPRTHRIDGSLWAEALGAVERLSDWTAYFANELDRVPWRELVGTWVPRLAPGLFGGAMHTVIRTGHAVRALEDRETELRFDELARALAYWAACYEELPGSPNGHGLLSPAYAVVELDPLPLSMRGKPGTIRQEMAALRMSHSFSHAINLTYPGAGTPDFLSELVATFAGIFLQGGDVVAFVHGITGPAAVRDLLPHLDSAGCRLLLAHTWQAAAGILARYGRRGQTGRVHVTGTSVDERRLAARAAANGDVHTITLTAACLREWRINPDPRLIKAAERGLDLLGPVG